MSPSRSWFAALLTLSVACSPDPPPKPATGTPWPDAHFTPKVTLVPIAPMRESGKMALLYARGQGVLLLADTDESALVLLDADSGATLGKKTLPCAPEQLVTALDGDVFVAEPRCNRVSRQRISAGGGNFDIEEIDSAGVAVEPVALGLTPDESALLVVSAWGRALTRFALPDLAEPRSVSLAREPRAVSCSDDGERIFVSHASGSALSEVSQELRVTEHSLASRVVSRVPARFPRWHHDMFLEFETHGQRIPFRHGVHFSVSASQLHATQGFSLLVRDGRVLVPEVLSNPGELGQVAHGYGVTGSPLPPTLQDVAVLDLTSNRANHASSFAIIEGWRQHEKNVCRLPRAAAYDDDRDTLLVACLGSDRVLEVDALARDPARAEVSEFKVPRGPSAIVLEPVGRKAFVWSRFARVVSVLDLGDGSPLARVPENSAQGRLRRANPTPEGQVLARYAVPRGAPKTPEAEQLLLGMALFHTSDDARISRDGRGCESCHPAGRDDGLSWRTGDQLAARQTPMLDGRIRDTAPYGWLGQHATLEQHLTNTIRNRLQGTGLDERELAALAAYVRALPGPPREVGALAEAAQRGKALFHRSDVACGDCHEDGDGVDGIQYAVSGTTATDTPSLRFVSGAGPYFHDGRYASLDVLLRDTQGVMGQHVVLSDADRADLVAFLESL